MYYVHPTGPPMPAKPLYEANFSERAMWEYSYGQHRDAILKVRTSVDTTKPRCDDPKLEEMRVYTRRFADHERCREIGRQNQNLVRKLYEISEGRGGRGQGGAGGPPPLVKLKAPPQLPKLRHDTLRRKVQFDIERENEGLVKRLMSVKTTLNMKKLEKDYKRHENTVRLRCKIQGAPPAGDRLMRSHAALGSSGGAVLPPLGRPGMVSTGDPFPQLAASFSAPSLAQGSRCVEIGLMREQLADTSVQQPRRVLDQVTTPSQKKPPLRDNEESWAGQKDTAAQTRRWVADGSMAPAVEVPTNEAGAGETPKHKPLVTAAAGPLENADVESRVAELEAEEEKVAEKLQKALQESSDETQRAVRSTECTERVRAVVYQEIQPPTVGFEADVIQESEVLAPPALPDAPRTITEPGQTPAFSPSGEPAERSSTEAVSAETIPSKSLAEEVPEQNSSSAEKAEAPAPNAWTKQNEALPTELETEGSKHVLAQDSITGLSQSIPPEKPISDEATGLKPAEAHVEPTSSDVPSEIPRDGKEAAAPATSQGNPAQEEAKEEILADEIDMSTPHEKEPEDKGVAKETPP